LETPSVRWGVIRVAEDGPVRVVTIDRPSRRNALTRADLDALAAAVPDAEGPSSGDGSAADGSSGSRVPSVVFLQGAGEAFCAGADLDVVAELDREGARAFAARGQRVVRAFEASPAVVVAGIDGAARGGGVEIALGCDVRVATPAASFAEPGVSLGIFGAWGGTARLPEVVGTGDAMDLALSGRVVDATEAHRMGLVSRVADDPRAVAAEIAAHPSDALTALKSLLRDRASWARREARELEAFGDLVASHGSEIAAERRE
jgi:enoyl-CoA hydratase